MKNDTESSQLFSIAATELETGLSKETLRVWERRYGFPKPVRNLIGDRRYTGEEVEHLRLIRQLLDFGHRPGELVALPATELHSLLSRKARPAMSEPDESAREAVDACMATLASFDGEALLARLERGRFELGVGRFVYELLAPLCSRVGTDWSEGRISVAQEHLFTAMVTKVMLVAIHATRSAEPATQPRVLLTTFSGEPHGLGLTMVHTLCAIERAQTVALGVQTPIADIVGAVNRCRADVLALSFSPCLGPTAITSGLAELRRRIAPEVEIWVGGSAPALRQRPLPGVRVFDSLQDVPEQLRRVRLQQCDRALAGPG